MQICDALVAIVNWLLELTRELKQPPRQRQHKHHKLAYLTMKNSIFARLARAFFIFWHFEDVLVLSTTWNDLFCRCVDDVSMWGQMFNFVFLCPKRWFQFNSRIVRTHFSSITSLNNWKMIAETRSHVFRWRSRFRRRRGCLSSLLTQPRRRRQQERHNFTYLSTKNNSFARFTWILLFSTCRRRSGSFYDVIWPVWQLCGRHEHDDEKSSILSCYLKSAASNLFPK